MDLDDAVAQREAFSILRGLLSDGWSLCDYQPGDATSYKLAFLHIRPPAWMPNAQNGGHGFSMGYVIVSWLGNACWQFDLLNKQAYFDPGYVGEKLGFGISRQATGAAMALLFNEIVNIQNKYRIDVNRNCFDRFGAKYTQVIFTPKDAS